MQTLTIIGVGRIGGALALALAGRGYRIDALVGRNRSGPPDFVQDLSPVPAWVPVSDSAGIASDTVLIATQDAEIVNAARWLAERLDDRRPVVLHTSGALGSEVLSDVADLGCPVGSVHPLVSVADPVAGAGRFSGAYFCLEGDQGAVAAAQDLVTALGGKPFRVAAGRKALYHAAAVMACGHLVALVDAAIEMLCEAGVARASASAVLAPLIASTVENLEASGPVSALTGPFARADGGTIEKHLAAIDRAGLGPALEIYADLGLRSLDLAAARGADAESLAAIREQILLAKSGPR